MAILAGGGSSAPTPAAALIVTGAFSIQHEVPQRRVLPLMMFALHAQRREQAQNIARQTHNNQRLQIDRHGFTPSSSRTSQFARQRFQPAPRPTPEYFAIDGEGHIGELAGVTHDECIRPRVVRHTFDIRQL